MDVAGGRVPVRRVDDRVSGHVVILPPVRQRRTDVDAGDPVARHDGGGRRHTPRCARGDPGVGAGAGRAGRFARRRVPGRVLHEDAFWVG